MYSEMTYGLHAGVSVRAAGSGTWLLKFRVAERAVSERRRWDIEICQPFQNMRNRSWVVMKAFSKGPSITKRPDEN